MYLVVDGLAYNQAQYNSLNCQWSILYHLCCSYVVPHVVCIYAILRIIDIYVETLFFSRVPTVNIAQKNFGNILWKHFKIFSFAGVRWGSHEACVKFFTVNEKYISRIWPIFLHAPHNPRQRLRWATRKHYFPLRVSANCIYKKLDIIYIVLPVVAMFGMFEDLGMISRWRIARDSLARFILLVRRGYR